MDANRIATVPNAISFARILLIPAFVALLLHQSTQTAGLVLLVFVVSTDWVDGYIARRTGQVSTLGKVLDPVADRLAIAAALITLVVRHAFPLWAALTILVRDGLLLLAGLALLAGRGRRIDVRFIGKVATFALMAGVPLVSWGSFGLPLAASARAVGWFAYGVGILEYYVAAFLYAADMRSRPAPRAPAL